METRSIMNSPQMRAMLRSTEARRELEPFTRFFDYVEESLKLIRLSRLGISLLPKMSATGVAKDVSTLLAVYQKTSKEKIDKEILNLIRESARHARGIAKDDYSLLYAYATVGLWSALEACIGDYLVGLILNNPRIRKLEQFGKVRISLAEFELLSEEERSRYLLDELERDVRSFHQPGIARFETIFQILGLAGKVDELVKRKIYPSTTRNLLELFYVRNLIVHRDGIVDRKFLKACPWLKLKAGRKLKIHDEDYWRYLMAANKYIALVLERRLLILEHLTARKQDGRLRTRPEARV